MGEYPSPRIPRTPSFNPNIKQSYTRTINSSISVMLTGMMHGLSPQAQSSATSICGHMQAFQLTSQLPSCKRRVYVFFLPISYPSKPLETDCLIFRRLDPPGTTSLTIYHCCLHLLPPSSRMSFKYTSKVLLKMSRTCLHGGSRTEGFTPVSLRWCWTT